MRLTGFRSVFAAAALLFGSAQAAPFSLFSFLFPGSEWDVNGDGLVRVTLLSVPELDGGIRAANLCADLEKMLKAGMSRPVRVNHEPVTQGKSLMSWYYHPDAGEARARLFPGEIDLVLLAEDASVVTGYPEFFFEGVRAISGRLDPKKTKAMVLLTVRPGTSYRDKRVSAVANCTYRVAEGCGLEVIPGAYAWTQTLARNRLRGDSSIKARAGAFLYAASVWSSIANNRAPSAACQTDWTVKETARQLTESALEAVREERDKSHFAGPFKGTVRVEPRIRNRLKIFLPNTAEEDPVRLNFEAVLDAARVEAFWRTPADWFRDGFDRYSTCFDFVFGDIPQIDVYRNRSLYTSPDPQPTNVPPPAVAVFTRLPEGTREDRVVLENLETLLFKGYDYAKENGLVYIPYPLAWARAREQRPELAVLETSGKPGDWLDYMLANMLYTVISERFQPPPENAGPHLASLAHPYGFHEACARIGYTTIVQLASLRTVSNTLLLRSDAGRAGRGAPAFASVRLLDKPAADVTVYCATDKPEAAELSRTELLFTPDNYDIEQTVRIDPVTNAPAVFTYFMAGARSEDPGIDGRNDVRPIVLNYDEQVACTVRFDRDEVSPATGFAVRISASDRPADIVCARIRQNGLVAQERYLVPEYADGAMFRLHPTEEDYRRGEIQIDVYLSSTDLRFNGRKIAQTFKLRKPEGVLPDLRLVEPVRDVPIKGPAFVSARAESDATTGVSRITLYLGQKGLLARHGTSCAAPVESGPPQSRLPSGTYQLWAEAETTNGTVIATRPQLLRVE